MSWQKKRKKTKKARQTANRVCFSLTEAMEKSKNRQAAYHIILKVSYAKLIYHEKRNKFAISPNTHTTALIILQPAVLSQRWNLLHVFFQRICQNFKTRKQEILILECFKSSSQLAFCKIGVLKTSAKFLGKQICGNLFSEKL